MHGKRYQWHIYSLTRSFGSSPSFASSAELAELQGYSSLYGVSEETAQAIVKAGTTEGFKGIVYSERLWADFDSYEAAEWAESKLKEAGYGYVAYDSGGRGAHFGIRRDCDPGHTLPQRDKAWVRAFFERGGKCAADLSVYTHLHLFRLPGTIHESTSRVKELVSTHSGRSVKLPAWQELKGAQRVQVVTNSVDRSGNISIFHSLRILHASQEASAGERHPQLVRCAYALRDHGVDPQFALGWLQELNKSFPEPKDEREAEAIIQRVFGSIP